MTAFVLLQQEAISGQRTGQSELKQEIIWVRFRTRRLLLSSPQQIRLVRMGLASLNTLTLILQSSTRYFRQWALRPLQNIVPRRSRFIGRAT
jgi:hypothetical protein